MRLSHGNSELLIVIDVIACSMTARGWRSAPRRSQSGKCRRKCQLRRSRPPERPAFACWAISRRFTVRGRDAARLQIWPS